MQSNAIDVDAYIAEIEDEVRQKECRDLRNVIKRHVPEGFAELMSCGMPACVVPHSIYPAGYHCDPSLPLPFISFASQTQHVSFYHMGIYANSKLLKWFQAEYEKRIPTKLNMGKSCVRIRKMTPEILELLGELCEKVTVQEWISLYEESIKG